MVGESVVGGWFVCVWFVVGVWVGRGVGVGGWCVWWVGGVCGVVCVCVYECGWSDTSVN